MGIRVVVGDRESITTTLRRLKKQMEREGMTWEVRRRLYFVSGTELRERSGSRGGKPAS